MTYQGHESGIEDSEGDRPVTCVTELAMEREDAQDKDN